MVKKNRGTEKKQKQQQHGMSATAMDEEISSLTARIEAEAPAIGSTPPSGVVAFASLPLSTFTLSGLAKANYTSMTSIQSASIPHALAGRDILGAAKTGSGKTLSFVVPILECLYRHRWSGKADGPGAVVLSPTRELAGQIFAVLRLVGSYHKSLSVGLLVGGKKDMVTEQQHVPYTNILIATPGRLLQHLEQTPMFNVDNLKMLVLDEADRILDMGFRDQLIRIIDYLPQEKQTLLFSATQTKDVSHLVTLSMNRNSMEYVGVHDKANFNTPDMLQQSYVLVPLPHKLNCVYSFLKSHLKSKTIMFFATCSQVRHAWELFCSLRPGLSVMALHGKLCQSKRTEVYDKFLQMPHAVLFATDIASRGLDFPDVDWVVQVDAPEDQDMYIHRVGRTARYKNKGNALLLLDPLEEKTLQQWMTSKKLPMKKKSINPTKTVLVTQRAASLAAGDMKLHQLAKKAFSSYARSLALLPNLGFQVQELALAEFATSLGLASMPNLRLLESVSSREGLRKAKNVNRKLQKLKEQIKAEKLAKKIAKLGGPAPGPDAKKRKKNGSDEEDDNSDEEDDWLVVKKRQLPQEGEDNQMEEEPLVEFNIHEVTKSRHAKKIRVEGGAVGKHVVFDDDGEVQQGILSAAVEEAKMTEMDKQKLEQANEVYLQQVRQRLERTETQDKAEEKERIRAKHRKKRIQKKDKQKEGDAGGVAIATLGPLDDDDDDDDVASSASASSSSGSSSEDDESSSSSSEENAGAGLEDIALSMIRGGA